MGETMSLIHNALVSILEDSATVGALAADRIYPLVIPQGGTLPAISYQEVSGERLHTLDGADMAHPVFQLTCWAETYGEAKAMADAIRLLLNGYSGTVDTIVIQYVRMVGENDLGWVSPENDELRRYGVAQDFQVHHTETIS